MLNFILVFFCLMGVVFQVQATTNATCQGMSPGRGQVSNNARLLFVGDTQPTVDIPVLCVLFLRIKTSDFHCTAYNGMPN